MNKNKFLLASALSLLLFSSESEGMERMKGKLGVYHLMIASKYFNSIDNFINLELATPKARGNMEKFHFNPIDLDKWSRKFFTSLETLHVYNKNDDHFTNEDFYKKVIWYDVNYTKYNEMKKENEIKKDNEIYKNVVLTQGEAKRLKLDRIPEGVTSLGKGCFKGCSSLTKICIGTNKEVTITAQGDPTGSVRELVKEERESLHK